MSAESIWNDSARSNLRVTLRNVVAGEVRLGKSGHDEIIQICREVYIEDRCPEDERASFVCYATEELKKAEAAHFVEQAAWPAETDCDRLDQVEAVLRDRGILLWQMSPCCDSCTGGELADRIAEIERRCCGFRGRVRGYGFFVDQNMAAMLVENKILSIYLAYGWLSHDESSIAPDVYERNALSVALEICHCLREHGFKPTWDGSLANKIGLSLNWQRRTMLV